MVIKDSSDTYENSKLPSSSASMPAVELFLASPLDRLAAFVIDYVILLTPVLYLVVSPFRRIMRQAVLNDSSAEISIAILYSVLLSITITLLYQVLFVWLWRATPGKKIVGLEVQHLGDGKSYQNQSFDNQKISLHHAVLRAGYWSISVLLFGVPFLSTYSHKLRRTLHDRISDTVVVTRHARRAAGSPSIREKGLIYGVYSSVIVVLIGVIFFSVSSTINNWRQQSQLISALESEDVLCDEVSAAQAEWAKVQSDKTSVDNNRLSVALSLYLAGSIPAKCIEAEVEQLHSVEATGPLLSLVKSFAYSDHAELSDLYLENVCEEDKKSKECLFSQLIQSANESDWAFIDQNRANLLNDAEIYETIWLTKQYMTIENFEAANELIEKLPESRFMSDLINPIKVKILWGLGHSNESIAAEGIAYSSISDAAKIELSSFMCFEQIWSDCQKITETSCKQFQKIATQSEDGLSDVKSSLAFMRSWECNSKLSSEGKATATKDDYESLLIQPINSEVKQLILALQKDDTADLSNMFEDPSVDDELRQEIYRRIVERTNKISEVKSLVDDWRDGPNSLGWQKVGVSLFEKLFKLKEYAGSLSVAENLLSRDSDELSRQSPSIYYSKVFSENVIVAAVKAKNWARAKELLVNYKSNYPDPMAYSFERSPASVSEFIASVKSILAQGEE